MEKNKIFGYVSMGAAALLIISLFLPYVSIFSVSKSLWKMEDPSRVLFLLLGLFVIALYLLNKKTELSYLTTGFGTFYCITMAISAEGLEYFSIGFYLLLLSSLSIGVMTFLYDENKGTSLINLSINKPVNNNSNIQQPVVNQMQQQPVNNSQPQTIVGYDPMTGAPIYSNQNNN